MIGTEAAIISLVIGLLVSFCVGQIGSVLKSIGLIEVAFYALFMGIIVTVATVLSYMLVLIS